MAKKSNDTDLVEAYPEETVFGTQTESTKTAQVQSKPPRLAYVGPNVPGGILQRFQIFKGGLPPHCAGLFKIVPEIRELFVPVEGLEATRRKIEESGTNEARLFYIVSKKLAKGVK
ncbi:MAG: hypothetical protein LBQ90_12340 [Synergistaceae bacterium]|jgi:hypothetical protein|nr:hypothetical protein [Synergistaceae bacterium]